MIYIVLGCHKSGTTLVGEILHRSGIPMVEEGESVQSDYDAGDYFERREWVHLNQDILGFGNPVEDHPAPRQIFASEATRQGIRRQILRCERAHEDWGFKDPRTCLTYPVWREELPEHVVVGVYRSLEEFWGNRLTKRRKRHSFWKAVRMWCDYNRCLADVLERRQALGQPFVLLRYELLMDGDDEFLRLQAFIGRGLVDPRKAARYRSQARGRIRLAIADRVMNAVGLPQPTKITRRLERLAAHPVVSGDDPLLP